VTATLTALSPGPVPLSPTLGGLTSNGVTFTVVLAGEPELSAERNSPEFLAPTETVLTLKRGGAPLPTSSRVILTPVAAWTLASLSAGHVTGKGGKATVNGLMPVRAGRGQRSGPAGGNGPARRGATVRPGRGRWSRTTLSGSAPGPKPRPARQSEPSWTGP
jgi:hypothetical protein